MIKWGDFLKYEKPEYVKYEFEIGDRVETFKCRFFHTFTRRGTIIDRSPAKWCDNHWTPASAWALCKNKELKEMGAVYYIPTYKVELDCGKTKWFKQNEVSL